MSSRIATVPLAVLLAVPLAAAAAADAGGGARQDVRFTLTEKRPARASGERFRIDYGNPADPKGKPRPIRAVTATLPRGARIDTGVPGACTASDSELVARGAAACPAGSRVGRGTGTVDTGFPGPFRSVPATTQVFNTRGGFLTVNSARDLPYRNVFRFRVVSGRTWTTTVPSLPGTPPDGGALDHVNIDIFRVTRRRGGRMRSYITTPRRCPKRRYWVTTMRFTYDGGVTQTETTRTPCSRKRYR